MANITEILGTDSLSSSRLTINSNFSALNSEIADLTALVDPTTSTISGITSISAESLDLLQGSTQILSIDNTTAEFSVTADFNEGVNFDKSVSMSGTLGSGGSGNGQTNASPSFADVSTCFTNVGITLPPGSEGQVVTVISTGAGLSVGGSIAATSITLTAVNSSVTLKYINMTWYIIAAYNATIA